MGLQRNEALDSLKATLAGFHEAAESSFEDMLVNHLFSRYNLPRDVKRQMLKLTKSRDGKPRLLLLDFHQAFPEFPIYLFARKFEKSPAKATPLHKLLLAVEDLPFVKAFDELAEFLPEEYASYAMVFHWSYLQRKSAGQMETGLSAMSLHNRHVSQLQASPIVCWDSIDRGYPVYLQPLTGLLDTIDQECGTDWRYERGGDYGVTQ